MDPQPAVSHSIIAYNWLVSWHVWGVRIRTVSPRSVKFGKASLIGARSDSNVSSVKNQNQTADDAAQLRTLCLHYWLVCMLLKKLNCYWKYLLILAFYELLVSPERLGKKQIKLFRTLNGKQIFSLIQIEISIWGLELKGEPDYSKFCDFYSHFQKT